MTAGSDETRCAVFVGGLERRSQLVEHLAPLEHVRLRPGERSERCLPRFVEGVAPPPALDEREPHYPGRPHGPQS